MKYSGSVMRCARTSKSSGLTTRRLEGIIAAFIWASRKNPVTRKLVAASPVPTVMVSPIRAAPVTE